MNEAIENEARQSEVPEGLTHACMRISGGLTHACMHAPRQVPEGLTQEQFRTLVQMRTDGVEEEKVQAELWRMRREDMEQAQKQTPQHRALPTPCTFPCPLCTADSARRVRHRRRST